MRDIFTDLYNKVLGFFRQAEKKEEESTKDVACNRLKFVLMQDRTNLTPELMDRMRKELVELLSKYVEMDKEALELGFEQEGTQMALMLSIPVVRAKDEAEIEAVLAKEDEEKAKLAEPIQKEVNLARILTENGHSWYFTPENHTEGIKNPDGIFDGKTADMKTLTSKKLDKLKDRILECDGQKVNTACIHILNTTYYSKKEAVEYTREVMNLGLKYVKEVVLVYGNEINILK